MDPPKPQGVPSWTPLNQGRNSMEAESSVSKCESVVEREVLAAEKNIGVENTAAPRGGGWI